jgi:thiol:disulfide interchange protein DsbA
MDRKQFLTLISAGAVGAWAGLQPAFAQSPSADVGFRRLKTAAPTTADAGKVEVVEFFWFGCPHCYSLEPFLQAWMKQLPADVTFRRVHVPFSEVRHQQLYFALQAMGKDQEAVLTQVFSAIHLQKKRMRDVKEITETLASQGVDPKAFEEAFNSFGVRTRMQQANRLADAYGIDGVPALGVAGKYLTAPSIAGSNEAAIRVVNELIARERKGV